MRPRALDDIGEGRILVLLWHLQHLEGCVHAKDGIVGQVRVHHVEGGRGVQLQQEHGRRAVHEESAEAGVLGQLWAHAGTVERLGVGEPHLGAGNVGHGDPLVPLRDQRRAQHAPPPSLLSDADASDRLKLACHLGGRSGAGCRRDSSLRCHGPLTHLVQLLLGLLTFAALLLLLLAPLCRLELRLALLLDLLLPKRLRLNPRARQHDALSNFCKHTHLNAAVRRQVTHARPQLAAHGHLAFGRLPRLKISAALPAPLYGVLGGGDQARPGQLERLGDIPLHLQDRPLRDELCLAVLCPLDKDPRALRGQEAWPALTLLQLRGFQVEPAARREAAHDGAELKAADGGRVLGGLLADVHERSLDHQECEGLSVQRGAHVLHHRLELLCPRCAWCLALLLCLLGVEELAEQLSGLCRA
mmetsp:Transcript_35668/g.96778  ORF Transcript_35668/g.96778 Transcript_35668/m.96778 type:complete len:416 (+) Transcript_35668:707-1954(+)